MVKLSMPKVQKRSTKEWLLGSYDYKYLCTPQWPFKAAKRDPPQFFPVDAWLGLFTACIMGLQHALAMIGGLITPATLVGALAFTDKTLTLKEQQSVQQYLISSSLIICGITTFIQVTGIPLPRGRQLGAGVLSVMGVSFTTVSIAISVLGTMMKEDGETFHTAYGKLVGTVALCGLVPVFISLMPMKAIKKIFPPIVCGVTIVLIGIYLAGKGMSNWGGGTFCGDNYKGLDGGPLGPCTFFNATSGFNETKAACYQPKIFPLKCSGNGDVKLPFGSPQYVGLGFSVFSMLILIELFGSPFLRNVSVIIALMFGYMLAAVTTSGGQKFVTSAQINAAPAFTFIWTTTFPLGLYVPAILPLIIIFCITSIETVGDVAATEEASYINTTGPKHDKRIRGALLNDGISSIFAGLATSLPLTTFAQNNGVIALTAVASRQAGWSCAIWLFLFGIVGKFGAFMATIPNCVLGGMTTFLFANVIASGIKIISNCHLNRRNRFIIACSMGLGIGVTAYPQWANTALWPCVGCSQGLRSLRDAIILILSSGLTLGAITACLLNLLLPGEKALIVPQPSGKDMLGVSPEPTVRYKGSSDDDNPSLDPSVARADEFAAPQQEPMHKYDSGVPAGAIAAV